ncbi:MAG: diacylglycerol kinase family protein [Bacteroidales bacterium]|nr:diacylglycerol kinase family protein [Bacteroidales bacterium]
MENISQSRYSLTARKRSFVYAWKGIISVIRNQPNFQIQLGVTVIVLICGFLAGLSAFEWLAVIIMIGSVLSAEVMNSALEYLVDFVSPDYHELAGKVKDIAAGAVLVTAIAAVIVGLIIFIPKLYFLIFAG